SLDWFGSWTATRTKKSAHIVLCIQGFFQSTLSVNPDNSSTVVFSDDCIDHRHAEKPNAHTDQIDESAKSMRHHVIL
ncbi:MAG: hypothetical protein VCC01_06980, partial [Candidatus Hydrogenedentota bacterium]